MDRDKSMQSINHVPKVNSDNGYLFDLLGLRDETESSRFDKFVDNFSTMVDTFMRDSPEHFQDEIYLNLTPSPIKTNKACTPPVKPDEPIQNDLIDFKYPLIVTDSDSNYDCDSNTQEDDTGGNIEISSTNILMPDINYSIMASTEEINEPVTTDIIVSTSDETSDKIPNDLLTESVSTTEPEITISSESLPYLSYEDLLTNLKILCEIKEGQKLVCNGKFLNVDDYIFLQFIARRCRGQNGVKTVEFIEHLVNCAKTQCADLRDKLSETEKYDAKDIQYRLNDLTVALGNIKDGLENLKSTYKTHNNVSIHVRLDTCITNFKRIAENNME